MSTLKKKINAIFRKQKEVVIAKQNYLDRYSPDEEYRYSKKNNISEFFNINPQILLTAKEYYENITSYKKVNIQGFNSKTKELISAAALYDLESGLIKGVIGKELMELSNLERLTWTSSETSSEVYYGYADKLSGDIFSDSYVINNVKDLKDNNYHVTAFYSRNNKELTINYSKELEECNIRIKVFSICGLINLEEKLNKLGLILVRK